MAEVSDNWGILYQNLIDAGCGETLSRQVLGLIASERSAEVLALLKTHRRNLLDLYHAEQRKLACLDYLVHQMEKSGR